MCLFVCVALSERSGIKAEGFGLLLVQPTRPLLVAVQSMYFHPSPANQGSRGMKRDASNDTFGRFSNFCSNEVTDSSSRAVTRCTDEIIRVQFNLLMWAERGPL